MSKTGMLAAVAEAIGEQETADEAKTEIEETADEAKTDEAAIDTAVKAERSRVLGIAAAAFPGQEKLAASLIESGASLGEAALAFNADHKAKGAKVMANLEADEAAVKGLRSEPANGAEAPKNPLAGLQGEALWKAEYSGSAELQAEFGSEPSYVSFKRAEANGRVRILNKKSA